MSISNGRDILRLRYNNRWYIVFGCNFGCSAELYLCRKFFGALVVLPYPIRQI
jgi:hypothetical protein